MVEGMGRILWKNGRVQLKDEDESMVEWEWSCLKKDRIVLEEEDERTI